jgi:uncharacterized metal-binding protein YceD (DUF177 family)
MAGLGELRVICKLFGHKWKPTAQVCCNPDPHPLYIQGTFFITVEMECVRCGEVERTKDYDYWAEQGFADKTSYRFHDHPEDVDEYNKTHCRHGRLR